MKVEIRTHQDEETGDEYRAIFVENELFDWGLDPVSLRRAKILARREPLMKRSVMGDIQKHFVECFSEFVGRSVTLEEVNRALETGEL